MSDKKISIRALVMLAAILGIVIYLVASDEGEMKLAAQCVTGEGFGFVANDRVPFTGNFHGFEYTGTTNDLIDIHIYVTETYEPAVLRAMESIVTAIDKEPVFLDVGANTGTHTMFASKFSKKVIAIEPWPPILDRLKAHIEKNKITNVEIHPVGYASEKGEMPFYVPPDYNLGWGSFSETFRHGEKRPDVIQLPLVRGDDDLEGVPKITFLKMDIEGYEKPALVGLKNRLASDRPVVFFELNVVGDTAFTSTDDVQKTFPKDYLFFEIQYRTEMLWNVRGNLLLCADTSGDYELVELVYPSDGLARNVVALPAEHNDKIAMKSP